VEWTPSRSARARRLLELTREQILAFRRRVGALDERLPAGPDALRQIAWAGLKDSMPRAAVLSIHARMAGTQAGDWEHPALIQLWGPCHHAYVVSRDDLAVFTLSLMPDDARGRARAERLAEQLGVLLAGGGLPYDDAGQALGVNPNALRYAAPTGTVLIRWDGARRPTVWTVPPPAADPGGARLELARRHLHVFGPSTPRAFGEWAGLPQRAAIAAFAALEPELLPVRTPIGDAWLLASDEPLIRAAPAPAARARLLPSGDTFFLHQGDDRRLLVPDPVRRGELWTSRVWPGAVLCDGEVRGVWRRADRLLTISPWGRLGRAARDAIEAEAAALPLPGVDRVDVRWDS